MGSWRRFLLPAGVARSLAVKIKFL